jgi:hypothetical protein
MSLVLLGSTSGSVTLQEPAIAGSTVIDLPATSGTMAVTSGSPSFTNITATGTLTVNGNTTLGDASTDTILMTGAPSIGGAGLGMGMGFRNRIINGAMVIDQRNAGASITPTSQQYCVDRWVCGLTQSSKYTVQQTPSATETGFATRIAAGFSNYLGATSSSAYTVLTGDTFYIGQYIEGFNTADLSWGTASAKPITLSFLAYSSIAGTFGGALRNSANSRSYPFTFSIPAANTWTQISVTIAGDTSGTWIGATNGVGLRVNFSLGSGATYSGTSGAWAGAEYYSATGATSIMGTNGATFYFTGVQLEKGSTATSFDYRPYGTELQLCQRYLPTANAADYYTGLSATTTIAYSSIKFPVTARVAPTGISVSSVTGYTTTNGGGSPIAVTAIVFGGAGVNASLVRFDVASGLTAGQATATAIGTAPLLFTGCEL